ncbi:hypothetical protein AMS68_004374 [Peltaster fructicola]|uniref:Elongin-C n=1 Tax=Peltaster fructicola TaxID=286661 RepID=A0A6H0XVS0_9PEZI|nr:hypothetical protein AMS68_004374 [Peltaster fructicola]
MAETNYITLVSNDGFSFVVKRSAANVSHTLKGMLDVSRGFAESKTNMIRFENITGETLEVVAQYLYHKEKYLDTKDAPDLDLPLESVLEVLMAADYLDL